MLLHECCSSLTTIDDVEYLEMVHRFNYLDNCISSDDGHIRMKCPEAVKKVELI